MRVSAHPLAQRKDARPASFGVAVLNSSEKMLKCASRKSSVRSPSGRPLAVWPFYCVSSRRERIADGIDRWCRFGAGACSDLDVEGAPGGHLASRFSSAPIAAYLSHPLRSHSQHQDEQQCFLHAEVSDIVISWPARGQRSPMALSDLRAAFQNLELERVVKELNDSGIVTLPDLAVIRSSNLSAESKRSVIVALRLAGKRLVLLGRTTAGLQAFELARELGATLPIFLERISLTRSIPSRGTIEWKINLQEMQRQLGCICTKSTCTCENHFEMARCLGVFGSDGPEDLPAFGLAITVIGLYHSWTNSTIWSKLVKKIKHDCEGELVPFMARVAADFIYLSSRRWQDTDVLVPVPPSPVKFGRRGFAPTDLLAKEISSILGIPWRAALVRTPGPSTREASYDELSAQFSLDPRKRADLKGARILLVEDVVTTGKTVRICVQKLQPAEPEGVDVVAMARATRL